MCILDTTKITSKILYEHCGGNSLRMGGTIYYLHALSYCQVHYKGIMQIKSPSNVPTKYGLDAMLILQGLYSMNQLFKMQKVYTGYTVCSSIITLFFTNT